MYPIFGELMEERTTGQRGVMQYEKRVDAQKTKQTANFRLDVNQTIFVHTCILIKSAEPLYFCGCR